METLVVVTLDVQDDYMDEMENKHLNMMIRRQDAIFRRRIWFI